MIARLLADDVFLHARHVGNHWEGNELKWLIHSAE